MKRLLAFWRLGNFVLDNREALLSELLLARIAGAPVTWHRPQTSALSALFTLLTKEKP
jgi:hypothetical protein